MMSDDYVIGYGRPPKHTRFRTGQSGNPTGRLPGAPSFKRAIRDELAATIAVKDGGRTSEVSKMEALVKRLVAGALSGNPRMLSELLRQINLHMSESEGAERATLPASEDDARLLLEFAQRALGKHGGVDMDPEAGDADKF